LENPVVLRDYPAISLTMRTLREAGECPALSRRSKVRKTKSHGNKNAATQKAAMLLRDD
jgi:hypothetical protein